MKPEYQKLIDDAEARLKSAKTAKEREVATSNLRAAKAVVSALIFNEKEMKILS